MLILPFWNTWCQQQVGISSHGKEIIPFKAAGADSFHQNKFVMDQRWCSGKGFHGAQRIPWSSTRSDQVFKKTPDRLPSREEVTLRIIQQEKKILKRTDVKIRGKMGINEP